MQRKNLTIILLCLFISVACNLFEKDRSPLTTQMPDPVLAALTQNTELLFKIDDDIQLSNLSGFKRMDDLSQDISKDEIEATILFHLSSYYFKITDGKLTVETTIDPPAQASLTNSNGEVQMVFDIDGTNTKASFRGRLVGDRISGSYTVMRSAYIYYTFYGWTYNADFEAPLVWLTAADWPPASPQITNAGEENGCIYISWEPGNSVPVEHYVLYRSLGIVADLEEYATLTETEYTDCSIQGYTSYDTTYYLIPVSANGLEGRRSRLILCSFSELLYTSPSCHLSDD